MLMPKAAVDEHGDSMLWKDQIRGAGKIAAVKAKAITEGMRGPAHPQLRPGILRTNSRHVSAALNRS